MTDEEALAHCAFAAAAWGGDAKFERDDQDKVDAHWEAVVQVLAMVGVNFDPPPNGGEGWLA